MILVLVFHNRYRTTLWNLNGTKNNINMFKFRIKQKSLKMWRHYLAERGRQSCCCRIMLLFIMHQQLDTYTSS